MSQSAEPAGGSRRARSLALRIAALVAVLAVVVWVNEIAADSLQTREAVRRFGYLGLFGVASLSGFNILVPIPVIAFFPFLIESGMQPVPAVMVIAAGMTVGDMVGYLLGRAGRKLVPRRGWLLRLERMRERHRIAPYGFLFVYAALAPIPNELVVIPMAIIGARWYGVAGAALGGNLIFNSLAAAGFHGVFSLW